MEKFKKWLSDNTLLSDVSIKKYASAVKVISSMMLDEKVICKSIYDMKRSELEVAINSIFKNAKFVEKNEKGKRMYSNGLKHYRCYYVYSYNVDDDDDMDEVNDNQLQEKINKFYNLDNKKTEKLVYIKSRIGQPKYREKLIEKYNGECVVTGISIRTILVASHIKPWAVSTDYERMDVNNGLLLCANMDKLFDCGLITFRNNGKIEISRLIDNANRKKLYLQNDLTINFQLNEKSKMYLDYHRENLFVE